MLTRRKWIASSLSASAATAAPPGADLDFAALIPQRVPRSAAFHDPTHHLWDPAMVRTPDGMCHLFYSRWKVGLGFDAWATHSEIVRATASRPEGPYRFAGPALPSRGADWWDGHSVYNACMLAYEGKYYLYYTGNRGPASWRPDRRLTMKDEDWWTQRNSQRVGVAVADHPAGPWQRSEAPLIDTGPETGAGIIAVPNAIAPPGGGVLLYYKTLARGEGRFGGGVFHYVAIGDGPLGPFRRHPKPMIDKQQVLGTATRFDFHLDDHVEWWQDGRYYAIAKDHDAPFITPHGRSLILLESGDGLDWRLARHTLVKDFEIAWSDGQKQTFERLEMPKLHLEKGTPRVLFLAARAARSESPSFLVAIPLLSK